MFIYQTRVFEGTPEPKAPAGAVVSKAYFITTHTASRGNTAKSFSNLAEAEAFLAANAPIPPSKPTVDVSPAQEAGYRWRQPKAKHKKFPCEWAQFNDYHAGEVYVKDRKLVGAKILTKKQYEHHGVILTEMRRIVEFERPYHYHNYNVRVQALERYYSIERVSYSKVPFMLTVGGDFPNPPLNADVRTLAITAAYGSIWDGEWDPATFLGELPETLAMKSDVVAKYESLVAYSKLIRDAPDFLFGRRAFTRKGMKSRYARRLSAETVSQYTDAWMQWRFNLLPMLQDFEDMKAAFSAKQIVGKTAYTYRGSAKDTQRAYRNIDYLGVPMTFEKVVEHSCKAVVRVKGFGASPNRFTLNPLASAWELVRLSWLVDRFVNVGDTLASLQGKRFVGEARHCSTLRVTATEIIRVQQGESKRTTSGDTPKPGSYTVTEEVVINDTEPYTKRTKALSRQPDAGAPGLALKRPSNNPDHPLDYFSLVWGKLRNGPLLSRR